jgi:mycothiol synthase
MAQDEEIGLPEEYTIRHARDQDAPAVVTLMDASDTSFGAPIAPYPAVELRAAWANQDLERDTWLIVAPDGALAAYGEINDRGAGKLHSDGYVHPDHRGKGLGTTIVRLMEARAREQVDAIPVDGQATLGTGITLLDQAARELLTCEGYHRVRVFHEMRIELTEQPVVRDLPAGLRLRTFVPGRDERAVYETVGAAFADHWNHVPMPFEEWISRTKRADFDPAVWLLAEADDGTIPAVALGTLREDLGWINLIGTRRDWRGRGLASALLRASFRAFWAHGKRVVALGVDAESLTGATRVYEAAGMRAASSTVVFEKELRAGIDLAAPASQG